MISRTGTLCRIIKQVNFPDGMVRVLVRGISRITMLRVNKNDEYDEAAYEKIEDTVENKDELQGLAKSAASLFTDASLFNPVQEDFKLAVSAVSKPGRMADLMADMPLVQLAQMSAANRLEADPELAQPENAPLRMAVARLFAQVGAQGLN
jgi:ATP-dependent Lon protease